MLRYTDLTTQELDYLVKELETVANLTQGAEETVVFMKDTAVSHQKSAPQGDAPSALRLLG